MKRSVNRRGDSVNRPYVGRQLETFSRGQQVVVLLIIFGMTLLFFHSINQPQSPRVGRAVPVNYWWAQPTLPYNQLPQPATDHRPLTTEKLTGAQLLTLNKKINLNTATKNDLAAIPGIGPKTAEKIIDYRKEYRRFETIEDIMKVQGIKEKKFEKIKRFLTVK